VNIKKIIENQSYHTFGRQVCVKKLGQYCGTIFNFGYISEISEKKKQ